MLHGRYVVEKEGDWRATNRIYIDVDLGHPPLTFADSAGFLTSQPENIPPVESPGKFPCPVLGAVRTSVF